MNQNTVTGDYININLRQLGATSIKEFNSIMHIAEFDLGDGLIVSYVFNITRHNKYGTYDDRSGNYRFYYSRLKAF